MILTAFEALLASVFPLECQGCGKSLPPSTSKLCQGCASLLAEQKFAWEDCWHPTPTHGIRSAWSALRYQGLAKDFLHRVKFKHEFYLLEALALRSSQLFGAILSETTYDAILPMPIAFPGRWNRRFNQTEILAHYLNRPGIIPVEKNILTKRWGFSPQHGLSKEARRWNLFGAFKINHPGRIRGKTFLLLDDIITTGATASEAASQLLKHGAKHVDLFTLARSEKLARVELRGKSS